MSAKRPIVRRISGNVNSFAAGRMVLLTSAENQRDHEEGHPASRPRDPRDDDGGDPQRSGVYEQSSEKRHGGSVSNWPRRATIPAC